MGEAVKIASNKDNGKIAKYSHLCYKLVLTRQLLINMQKIILIVLGLILVIGGGAYLWKTRINRGLSGLRIESIPESEVTLDDKDLGKTPIDLKDYKPGEYTIKLSAGSLTWENKIKLIPNVETYIKRELGESERLSSGVILTLEKNSSSKTELAIVTTPDGATVTLDGENKGNTPLMISDKPPGNYQLQVSATGYKSQLVKIKISSGYKLNAMFELAVDETLPQASPSPSSSTNPKTSPQATPKTSPTASSSASPKLKSTPPPKPYIQVLETPTNYLNVRKEPNKSAEILTKIYPTEYYPYLDEQGSGEDIWYKISYGDSQEGWVSAQYAKKFE